MEKIQTKPGDWVVLTNNEIRKITNQEEIDFFESDKIPISIARHLTEEENPEFAFDFIFGSNMNKENFFDIAMKKCPLAMKEFCVWIDQYKIRKKWSTLFQEGIKFHDIPFEMQFGIMVDFFSRFQPYEHTERGKGIKMQEIGMSLIQREVQIRNVDNLQKQ